MLDDKLNSFFKFNETAVNLRHERQKVLASNIANADTPGYKAQDFDFTDALKKATEGQGAGDSLQMAKTSNGHINSGSDISSFISEALQYRSAEQASLDGNTVDMDVERANFLDNSMRYQVEMSLLNSKIKGMRAAMREQ